jgi:voltage-gated potassium channel
MKNLDSLKSDLYVIIYEADTPAGRMFDIVLIWSIILSVIIVVLESVHIKDQSLREFFLHLVNGFSLFFLPLNTF